LLTVITTLVVVLNAMLFGGMYGSSPTLEGSIYIAYCFLQGLTYIFVAMIIGVLVRRGGLAMGIFFLYGLVFEQLLGGLMHKYVVEGAWYYFPLQTTDVLIPVTFANNIVYKDAPDNSVLIICAIGYILICTFFSVRRFQTADL
jgi:ABC-2 type transport system permease protein